MSGVLKCRWAGVGGLAPAKGRGIQYWFWHPLNTVVGKHTKLELGSWEGSLAGGWVGWGGARGRVLGTQVSGFE